MAKRKLNKSKQLRPQDAGERALVAALTKVEAEIEQNESGRGDREVDCVLFGLEFAADAIRYAIKDYRKAKVKIRREVKAELAEMRKADAYAAARLF